MTLGWHAKFERDELLRSRSKRTLSETEARAYASHLPTSEGKCHDDSGKAAGSSTFKAGCSLVCLADVKPELTEWLWPGRIPLGKLTIIEGHPGSGKSTVTLDLAARFSTGRAMPDGATRPPGNTLLVGIEDGLGDTIRPRLDAAYADLRRIWALEGIRQQQGSRRPLVLPDDLEHLEEAVLTNSIQLVVIDPLNAFLASSVDNYKDQDIRQALTPLSAMADRAGCAVLVVRHLSKSPRPSAVLAGGGSIGIIGVARSALLVARDPDDPTASVLAHVKCNIAPLAGSIRFSWVQTDGGAGRIVWGGQCEHSADSLVVPVEDVSSRSELSEAAEVLTEWLASGPVPKKELVTRARGHGIAARTLERAHARLGGTRTKEGFGEKSRMLWALPSHTRQRGTHTSAGEYRRVGGPESAVVTQVGHARQADATTVGEYGMASIQGASADLPNGAHIAPDHARPSS